MKAPKAKKIPHEIKLHGDIRVDNYYWLNERENPEVIDYLNEENRYTDFQLRETETLQENLFQEMKGRIKEDDDSVPYYYNEYWYQNRYKKGQEYPIYERWKKSSDKELLFDVNTMAEGYRYFHLRGISISPNNTLASFGVDTVSRRIYTLQFKNLETGKLLPDTIENTTGSAVWANDNQTIFYVKKDESLRAYQVYRHQIGTAVEEDVLVFEEKDETFSTFVGKSKSKKYIIIGSSATVSDEYRFIDANTPTADFQIIQARERGLEYSVAHYGDYFYIRTNKDNAFNFKLMRTPVFATTKENWKDVVPHRNEVLLEGVDIFDDYLVVSEKENAVDKIILNRWDKNGKIISSMPLPMEEEVYSAYTSVNLEFTSEVLRYEYSSLTTPWSSMEYNMKTGEKKLLKQQEVLGDFDKENYLTERVWVEARDGNRIPVSLVRRKDLQTSPQNPLFLYGYGAYGHSIDPTFSSIRLSLLDRGFIYAIAHVRGGEEKGRPWYLEGKLLQKKNSFYDFIDVAKSLIEKNITSSDHLYAYGGSAGGLLMGAVLNEEPTLFKGVIAAVPFVDVLTTMMDETIPLTTGEYDEWGNPADEEYYDYIKSYSPYDQVTAKDYTNLLVTTGLHDSQVQYFEPAKWVAKLRELKTDDNLLLLKTNMEAGHGGASGRFAPLKEVALDYAFLLQLEQKKN